MKINVLGLAGSPRRERNTDKLLEAFLNGARSAGAHTETLYVSVMQIAPCEACDGCARDGKCIITDDFQFVSEEVVASDIVVLSAPLYFAALPAQVKCFVDRAQCQWVRKYRLHMPLAASRNGYARRKGILLSAAGNPHANFDGMIRTVRYLFNVFETDFVNELLVGGVDDNVEIGDKTLQTAFSMGVETCRSLSV